MSIEERIAEIARKHFPEYISGACLCGASVDNLTQWAAHVAQVLVTELGLTEEHAIDKPGHRGINPQRRYVTPWENA